MIAERSRASTIRLGLAVIGTVLLCIGFVNAVIYALVGFGLAYATVLGVPTGGVGQAWYVLPMLPVTGALVIAALRERDHVRLTVGLFLLLAALTTAQCAGRG